jgi:8-oxo-dGTP diphosphatase
MATPQFGDPEHGRTYRDRPAAFAVVEHDGRIALVRVDERNGRFGILDLPGGGIDRGEGACEAATRETAEEAGLLVELEAEPFAFADHYFHPDPGRYVNTRGSFFAGRLVAEAPELKTETDHTLVWMAPADAVAALDRESHAWAVAAWLRRLQKRA